MAELGLVNDEAYAQRLAEELFRRKGYSPARIEQELIARGVARETAYEAARAIEGDPLERLAALLESKYAPSYKGTERDRRRVVNALQRLGYSFFDIRRAMEEHGMWQVADEALHF